MQLILKRILSYIINWGFTSAMDRHFRMLWIEGPAGVGKS